MKKLFCFLMVFALFMMSANAQRLTKCEVDKFSKAVIKETSSETLFTASPLGWGVTNRFKFKFKCVGKSVTMPAAILLASIEKYDENSGITLLLDNDETVVLKTCFTGIGGTKSSAGYEFDTCFELTENDVKLLRENKIVSIRISYMGGHYDRDLKENKQDLIKKMLEMLALFD